MSILSSPGLPGLVKVVAPADSGTPESRGVVYLDGQTVRWRKKVSGTSSGGPASVPEQDLLNGMPDALNAGQSFSSVFGEYIWIGGLTGFDAADTDNPYGTPTLLFGTASTTGGKQVRLDWLESYAGQLAEFRVVARSTGTFRIWATFYDRSDVGVGSYGSDTYTFDNDTQVMRVTVTVPGRGHYVKLYVQRTGGSSVMRIYTMAWRPVTKEPSYGATIALSREDYEGRYWLRSWRAQLAKIRTADGSSQAVAALIGDSWVDNLRIWAPLRTWLTATYGDAGVGWCPATGAAGGSHPAAPTGAVLTQTGTWMYRDQLATACAVDIDDATSVDVATPAAQQLTATWSSLGVQYLRQVDGGAFRYRVDSGAWTPVDTAHTSSVLTVLTLTETDGSHVLDVEVTSAGAAGVTLLGYDIQRAGNGVRIHKVGNGGANGSQYVSVNATIWEAGLTALAPDLALVLLGTNDHAQNVVPATFRGYIETLVGRIRAAMPLCDVILLAPADNYLTAQTYGIRDYALAGMRLAALNTGSAFLNGYRAFGLFDDAHARGMYDSSHIHLSAAGGQCYADLVVGRLLGDR